MKPARLFGILLIIWVLLDFLQAVVTPIHPDEAYYALYGQFLDWGYFDHPPMVALMTALSGLLAKGNLSVRLVTVLLHGATVWLVWRTLDDRQRDQRSVWVFFAIATSLVMFVAYGFYTTPDAPLLFFTALFFFLYKHYLSEPRWIVALGLSFAVTGMLYSKYMAVLVVFFFFFSNLKLVKDCKIWAALLLAALLFVPHIVWQVQHEFPSFQYHLMDRSSGFDVRHILEYVPYQLLVFNPVCLILAFVIIWRNRKTKDLFERACLFMVAGFVLFFFLMTIKGHVEPHWTVAVSVPMILVLHRHVQSPEWEKWISRGIVPMVCLVFLCRILLPVLASEKINIVGNKKKMEAIHAQCGNLPVVFVGSFQNPSMYRYYTGENAVPVSSVYGRRTQFDIWQFDKKLQGKELCIISDADAKSPVWNSRIITTPDAQFAFRKVAAFQGAGRIEVTVDHYRVQGDTITMDLSFYNPYDEPYDFYNPEYLTTLHAVYKLEEFFPITCPIPDAFVIPAKGTAKCTTSVLLIPDTPFVLCIDNGVCRSVNSVPLKVRKHD